MLMDIGNDGNPVQMNSDKRKEFFAKIVPYINDLPTELKHSILLEPKKVQGLNLLINKDTLKHFTIDGDSKIWGTLDYEKITEETIKQFANSVNQILESENKKLISEEVLQEVIKKLSVEKGIKVKDKQSKKILEQIITFFDKIQF